MFDREIGLGAGFAGRRPTLMPRKNPAAGGNGAPKAFCWAAERTHNSQKSVIFQALAAWRYRLVQLLLVLSNFGRWACL